MKVRDLKKLLEEASEDDEVVLAKDAEGNGYSPLAGSWLAIYVADSTWSGSVYMRELTEQDIADGYTEDDLMDDGDAGAFALVLTPVN